MKKLEVIADKIISSLKTFFLDYSEYRKAKKVVKEYYNPIYNHMDFLPSEVLYANLAIENIPQEIFNANITIDLWKNRRFLSKEKI